MTLKKLRTKKRLSVRKLSELSGVSGRTIEGYENGSRDINGAKLMTLLMLCDALDCRLSDILTDKELIMRLQARDRL